MDEILGRIKPSRSCRCGRQIIPSRFVLEEPTNPLTPASEQRLLMETARSKPKTRRFVKPAVTPDWASAPMWSAPAKRSGDGALASGGAVPKRTRGVVPRESGVVASLCHRTPKETPRGNLRWREERGFVEDQTRWGERTREPEASFKCLVSSFKACPARANLKLES